jgi:hypothetical protein
LNIPDALKKVHGGFRGDVLLMLGWGLYGLTKLPGLRLEFADRVSGIIWLLFIAAFVSAICQRRWRWAIFCLLSLPITAPRMGA